MDGLKSSRKIIKPSQAFSRLCTQPGVNKTQRPALLLFFQPLRVKGAGCTLLHLSVHGTLTQAPPSAGDSPQTGGNYSVGIASSGTQT